MNSKSIRLWDLPTRLFHWLLVVEVVAAIVSGQLGGNLIDWHGNIGLFIVGLVAFRVDLGRRWLNLCPLRPVFPDAGQDQSLSAAASGMVSGTTRLARFSVFGLLGLLAAQVFSGLFANDDITFTGPLFDLVSKDLSNQLTGFTTGFQRADRAGGLHLARSPSTGMSKKQIWSSR